MDWKWLNPWRELRQARETISMLEDECEALDREARDARRIAFAEAHEHFEMRTRHLQAHNDHLLRSAIDLANMRPVTVTLPDFPARTGG